MPITPTSEIAIRLFPETLRTVAFGSISGTYTGIGIPFENEIRLFHLQNLTDETLLFSFDGINDHEILPTMGFLLIDCTSNRTNIGGSLVIAQMTRIYVKQSGVPTSGAVYLAAYFAF